MYKLSLIFLLFTLPLLPSTAYFAIPLWAWVSVGISILYALTLILAVEKEWNDGSSDE